VEHGRPRIASVQGVIHPIRFVCTFWSYQLGIFSELNSPEKSPDTFSSGRMTRHFNGCGAAWTKRFPPVKCLWLAAGDTTLETKVAAKYRKIWGEGNVRGGPWKGDSSRLQYERDRQRR
jgi:hypothetical protein